jgi:antitoxin (DNA-binding transcriptional repressor) of toxin-antitoxin stability system
VILVSNHAIGTTDLPSCGPQEHVARKAVLGVTNNGRLASKLVPIRKAERSRTVPIDTGVLVPASRPRNVLEIVPAPIYLDTSALAKLLVAEAETPGRIDESCSTTRRIGTVRAGALPVERP